MAGKQIILTDYLTAAGVAVVGAGLLTQSEAVSQGVQNGLKICAGVLIPSLFPFMALVCFLSLTDAARILSIPLTPITTRLFKLPKELGAVVLLSLIGGYPVGAKSISLLLSQGKITKATAERMLCFCVNSGPSFLITAVGAGMLEDKTAGIILFGSQTVATLLIGMLVSLRIKTPPVESEGIRMNNDEAFVAAVSSASSAMIAMCSFAVLFSGILAFISASGIITTISSVLRIDEVLAKAVASGILEVTSGCAGAVELGGVTSFALISAAVSFGGFSVLFQIMSCFRENPISFRPLIVARILHIIPACLIAIPLYKRFCETSAVFATTSRPMVHTSTNSLIVSVCLLCMCIVMTLSTAEN